MIQLGHCDINLVEHCNFRCTACSHVSPFAKPFYMGIRDMVRDLEMLKPFARFEMVTLVGGEPLLHPAIVDFIRMAHHSGIAEKVCVITNGSLLPKMSEEFWEALEVLRISIYGKLDKAILPMAEERAERHGFELKSWPYPEFFYQLKSTPDDGIESFKACPWKSNCYTVHLGKFYLCPQSIFMPPRFLGHASTDGLPLEGLTEEKLSAYINRTEPFEACKICCAGEKKAFPWKESKNRTEWLKESTL